MGDVLGSIGGALGSIPGLANRSNAYGDLEKERQLYQGINPNVDMPDVAQGDPRTQAQQGQILQQAIQRMREGGLNAVDRARLAQIQNTQRQSTRAGQAAAINDAAQRGALQGNSGILGALVSGQEAANTASQQATDAAAIGQQSQIASTGQAGQLAQGIRGQNIGVEQGNINRKMAQNNMNKANQFEQANDIGRTWDESARLHEGAEAKDEKTGAAYGKTLGSIWDTFMKPGGGGGAGWGG